MFLQPLFPGENAVDQLVEIIKVLWDIISSLPFPDWLQFTYFCDGYLVGSWHTNS